MGRGWNKDIHLCGMVDGYIMKKDGILRRRKEYEKKKEIEERIRRGVNIEMEKIMRRQESMEGEGGSVKKIVNIGTSGGIEDNEVKEQGSKLREEAEWGEEWKSYWINRGKRLREEQGKSLKKYWTGKGKQMRRGW